ncbi:MAG TPA: YgcG family protein [Bradyrhizobium sp.]|jgi:uncharacterized protein|nr:YgcG family protein [Bradyrhizobium sp.]
MNAARAIILALTMCWAFAASADVAVPPLSGRVVDQTGTLSPGDIDRLTQILKGFEERKGSQVAVLIVPTTQPETIEQFSIRVADAWKIGRKKIDDGAILVVAKNDRKLRIEVGYGLEGALNDVTAKRIIDEIITPKFRSGDFAGGISDGVARILRVVDGEPLPAPAPQRQQQQQQSSDLTWLLNPLNPFTIIGILVLGGIFRGIFGRLFGSLTTGGLIGLVAWFIFGSLIVSALAAIVASAFTMFSDSITAPAPGGRGGWSGGLSSGGGWSSGGSSSSDSGGFSGGGGSFGGGGASGSW